MHRFYLPPEQCRGTTLTFNERESHHAAQVLRIQKNEEVTVLDGAGGEMRCRIIELSKRAVHAEVIERTVVPPLPCQVTLVQAIPKAKLIESIIQKATELGVTRIVPLLSERVATRLNSVEAEEKQEKWQQVAVEAIKQCGQPWLPLIEKPIAPEAFLSRREDQDLSLVASLHEGSRHPRDYFQEFLFKTGRQPKSVSIWVGPEGDFTPEEMRAIRAQALPMTLGRLVLRCETAATYCLSIVSYELQS
jgi:16S rRNA (uracil1498-N3)-methyltransferase